MRLKMLLWPLKKFMMTSNASKNHDPFDTDLEIKFIEPWILIMTRHVSWSYHLLGRKVYLFPRFSSDQLVYWHTIRITSPKEFVDYHNYNQSDFREGYKHCNDAGGPMPWTPWIGVQCIPSCDGAYENNCSIRAIENHHAQAKQQVRNRKLLLMPKSDALRNKLVSSRLRSGFTENYCYMRRKIPT